MPNYYTTKQFSENFLAMEMKKTKIKMNVPIYIGFTMWEFFYDYLKPKYEDKMKLCYTDIDSVAIHIKTKDFYEDINSDFEKWFGTSNYKIVRPLLITDKNKKVLGKFKDELGGKNYD